MDQNTEHIWTLMARKLSAEATVEELSELEMLLGQNPLENYSLEVMQDIWNNKGGSDPQYLENKYKELVTRMKRMGIDDEKFSGENDFIINNEEVSKPRQNLKPYLLGVLAVVIIFFASLLFYYQNAPANGIKEVPANNEVTTKYGSKSNLVLPDGTKVYLNGGSKLTYDKKFGTGLRVVYLSGEAYFDVVKNTSMPFVIHTRNMDIKVTGTAFNVKCYPEEKQTETSLIRGSIEITLRDREEKIILKPNEKLIIHDDVKPVKLNAYASKETAQPMLMLSHLTAMQDDIVETSWLDNKLVFNSEPFEEIAVRMERWFAVNIKFNNEKIKALKFTGVFENETIDQALNALQLTASFSYRINKDSIVIYK